MRRVALVALLALVAFVDAPPSHAKDRGVWGAIPNVISEIRWYALAIPSFVAATPALDETATEMTRSIRDVLSRSGPYPFKQSIDLNATPVGIDAPPEFSFWKTRGVRFLLAGRVSEASDGRLRAEIRLWDTVAERQTDGRVYLASVESKDQLAIAIAADIFERLDDSYRSFLSRIERP